MVSDLIPVVYMGGTCGDLVSSVLDPKNVRFDWVNRCMSINQDRQRLKKPYLFRDDMDKDQYISHMSTVYASLPSHDIDYHVRRGHRFIGIKINNHETSQWAAERFHRVHLPRVWQSICESCGIKSVDEYAELLRHYSDMIAQKTDRLISVEDIIDGSLIHRLQIMLDRPIDRPSINVYNNWLALQRNTFVS